MTNRYDTIPDKLIEILDIMDTEDGGAIISMEVDRELLLSVFAEWINTAIKEKCDEVLSAGTVEEARAMVEEDGSAPDTEEENIDWVQQMADGVIRSATDAENK